MYEIELKAHVNDKEKTKNILNSFAQYIHYVDKHDVYWLQKNTGSNPLNGISIRIREEINILNDGTSKNKIFVTHKRKNLQYNKNGNAIEVNQEYEFELTNREPFEAILEDSGYQVHLQKNKATDSWKFGKALFELSTIPLLGDFLEIEILSDTNDEETVTMYKNQLFTLLKKSGLNYTDVENRYYSEMIENLQRKKNNVQSI